MGRLCRLRDELNVSCSLSLTHTLQVKHNKRMHSNMIGDDADAIGDTEGGPDAAEPPQRHMTEKEHNHELARAVMSKKAKRLYDRMQHGISKKKESAKKLKQKRESLKKQKE